MRVADHSRECDARDDGGECKWCERGAQCERGAVVTARGRVPPKKRPSQKEPPPDLAESPTNKSPTLAAVGPQGGLENSSRSGYMEWMGDTISRPDPDPEVLPVSCRSSGTDMNLAFTPYGQALCTYVHVPAAYTSTVIAMVPTMKATAPALHDYFLNELQEDTFYQLVRGLRLQAALRRTRVAR